MRSSELAWLRQVLAFRTQREQFDQEAARLEQEARLFDHKWYAALAYVRANKLNHDVISGPNDRFGLIASGKVSEGMIPKIVSCSPG